ncbi:hypothetical protein V1525DRAFT_410668 [Lipomyces kononenkoae]|uniref:Uncharacterized protein n=1 Tax=Lipomyces kononenkoae TaxID=34357 RepID=A0ACC3SUZ6_LIPKO
MYEALKSFLAVIIDYYQFSLAAIYDFCDSRFPCEQPRSDLSNSWRWGYFLFCAVFIGLILPPRYRDSYSQNPSVCPSRNVR